MERYKNDASDDFFVFPSWVDVCQPADPPMIQQMCTNSADWNSFQSSPSEHDCNQSGCCTVTELVTDCNIFSIFRLGGGGVHNTSYEFSKQGGGGGRFSRFCIMIDDAKFWTPKTEFDN